MINREEMDAYAAEYVLGTLDHRERVAAAVLRASDAAMDGAIREWEQRLAPLNDRVNEATPSPELLGKIEFRVLTLPVSPPSKSPASDTIRRWQAFALVASLAFLVVTGMRYMQTAPLPAVSQVPHYVAVLQTTPSQPLFVVSLNAKIAKLDVHRLAADLPEDKSYELWLIPVNEKTPRPVGVLSQKDSEIPMIEGLDSLALTGATLAVSIEPAGGSPTGLPTGPVIVTGKFEQASL